MFEMTIRWSVGNTDYSIVRDKTSSASDSISPQLVERSALVLKLVEL